MRLKAISRALGCALLMCLPMLRAQEVPVVAQLMDGGGSVATAGFLHFELENCGNNFPSLASPGPSQNPWTVVRTAFDLKPNQPDGSIVGQVLANDQILCGNVASTYYQVTAMKDFDTPVSPVGGEPYVICSSSAPMDMSCSNPGGTTWNPALQQPAFQPVKPGFVQIFGNPQLSQVVKQPAGTALNLFGTFNFTNGFNTGPIVFSQLAALTGLANLVYVSDATLGSNPCIGGGTGSFAFYVAGAWTCAGLGSSAGTITGVTAGSGLSGGGVAGNIGLSLFTGCAVGQTLQFNGASWLCASVGAPAGLGAEVQFRNGAVFGSDPQFTYDLGAHALTLVNIILNGTMTWANAFGLSTSIPVSSACIPVAGKSALGISSDGNFATSNNGAPCVDINSSAIPAGVVKGSNLVSNGVSANPVYQDKPAIYVQDFVVGNGIADDTAGLTAAIAMACPTAQSGSRLILWNGNTGTPLRMKVASTVKAQKCWNLLWDGGSGEGETGTNTSCLIWGGAAGGTVLLVNQTRDSIFQNFCVLTQTGAGANNANIAIDIDEQPTITTISSNDQFRNILLQSLDSNASFVGFRLGAVATGNVEAMSFDHTTVVCAGHTATVSNNGAGYLIEGPSGAEPYVTQIHNVNTVNCSKGFDVEIANILDIDGGFASQDFTDLYLQGGRNISYRHIRSEAAAGASQIVIGQAGSSGGRDLTLEEDSFASLTNGTTTISYPFATTGGVIRLIKLDWDNNQTVTPFGPTGGGQFVGTFDSQDNNYPSATLCPVLTFAIRYVSINDQSFGNSSCFPGMVLGGGSAGFTLRSNPAVTTQSSPSPSITLQGANFSGGVSNIDAALLTHIPFAPTPTNSYIAFSHPSTISSFGMAPPPFFGGTTLLALTTPVLDGIVPIGTGGAATWTYKIVANDGNGGHTAASAASSTAIGNATLSGNNCNRVNWRPREGAYNYTIYRTVSATSPATTGIIATVWPSQDSPTGYVIPDCGLAGDGSVAPVTNTTGGITIAGPISTASGVRVANFYSGGNPGLIYCGTTGTCSNTQLLNSFEPFGTVPLSGGTFAVSGLPFASTTWLCNTWDITTPGTTSSMVQVTDATHATVTGTGTDVIGFSCRGN